MGLMCCMVCPAAKIYAWSFGEAALECCSVPVSLGLLREGCQAWPWMLSTILGLAGTCLVQVPAALGELPEPLKNPSTFLAASQGWQAARGSLGQLLPGLLTPAPLQHPKTLPAWPRSQQSLTPHPSWCCTVPAPRAGRRADVWVGSSHCSPSPGSTPTSPCFQHPSAQTHSQITVGSRG